MQHAKLDRLPMGMGEIVKTAGPRGEGKETPIKQYYTTAGNRAQVKVDMHKPEGYGGGRQTASAVAL